MLEAGRAAVVAGSITGNQVSVTLLFWFKETYLPLWQQRSGDLRSARSEHVYVLMMCGNSLAWPELRGDRNECLGRDSAALSENTIGHRSSSDGAPPPPTLRKAVLLVGCSHEDKIGKKRYQVIQPAACW